MTVGLLRVKNEARWIERSIRSIQPLCDRVLVMDDHSTDGTPDLADALGAEVFYSPFTGLDECRDKNWLLEKVRRDADWIIMIDGDEMLMPGCEERFRVAMKGEAPSISMRILYLWDSDSQIRVDKVYGEYRRHSAFRPKNHVYTSTTDGGFHCGNVPFRAMLSAVTIDAPLLHFGYMDAADRERKYCWYNSQDPANKVEDCYRHIAAGLSTPHSELIAKQTAMRAESRKPPLQLHEILPPAPSATDRTMHAGPMKIATLCSPHSQVA